MLDNLGEAQPSTFLVNKEFPAINRGTTSLSCSEPRARSLVLFLLLFLFEPIGSK